jgi:hypothetical protein
MTKNNVFDASSASSGGSSYFQKSGGPPASAVKTERETGSSDTFGEFDTIGGRFNGEPVVTGVSVVYLNQAEELCGGMVGGSGKVCVQLLNECEVSSHGKKRMSDTLGEGLYLRGSNTDCYQAPYLGKRYLTVALVEEFLGRTFEDTSEVVRYFSASEKHLMEKGIRATSLYDLDLIDQATQEVLNTKTPAKKRRVEDKATFGQVFDTVMSACKDELSEDNYVLLDAIKVLFEHTDAQSEDTKEGVYVVGEKIDNIIRQLGKWPAGTLQSAPPSLWIGLAQGVEELEVARAMGRKIAKLQEKVDELESGSLTRGRNSFGFSTGTTAIYDLEEKTEQGFNMIERDLRRIKGTSMLYNHLTIPSIGDLADSGQRMDTKIDHLKLTLDGLTSNLLQKQNALKGKGKSVSLGKHVFNTPSELEAWADVTFKKQVIPFGVFVDPYTILQRITSYRDVASESVIKDMKTRRDVQITADEEIAIASFDKPLPKLFRGVSNDNSPRAWVPGIPTKTRWEDEYGMAGVKLTILNNLDNVSDGLASAIEARISDQSTDSRECQALARELVASSISFLKSLCTFISETYRNLVNAGFNEGSAWDLVCKLVHRIFARDCHVVRGSVSEHLDASEKKAMAVNVLWATLATHQIIKEYTSHGIENHPSIASEYVRFLVANSGLGKLDKMEKKLVAAEKDIVDMKKDLKEARRIADKSTTRLDDMARTLKDLKKK